MTLVFLFTFAIGNVWATDFTFKGAYNATGSESWNTTTATTPIVTVAKDISNGSVGISCVSGSNAAYPKLNGNTKYIKFSVPEGYRITNANVTWRANTSNQKIIAIFGESLSSISNSVLTATNGGYVISNALSASGNTTCDGGEDFAISASHNAREVMFVRIMTYDKSTYASANTKYASFPCKFSSSASNKYPDLVGNASDVNIGKIILTVEAASSGPVDPTITFNNGNYTIGGAVLDLSSLFTSNSKGTVTYSITNTGTTGATLATDGKSFSATAVGTATVQASQATEEGKYKAKAVTATITVAACETSISAQPENASLKVGDANPTLSVTANNASAYAWKESSNGMDKDGAEVLGTGDTFTPSVNNAAQTKYYYCEVTSSCNGTTVVKSDIATVEVTLSVEPVVVYQWNTVGTTNLYSTAANSTVKIKNTTTNSVKFGNGVKITDGVWENHAAIIAAGDYAFLKGDKVTITHCYSKSSNSATKTGIWDGNATETTSPLASFESPNVNDGNTNATTSTYTLTANSDSLYVGRDGGGSGAHVTLLKVERPAIESATAVISAVKVNGTAISAANLATLLSEKSLTLSESASTTPTVNFYKTSTIKYVEDIEDGSYTKEIAATVTQPSNYKAVVTIDEVEYIINIPKAASTDATLSALTVGGEAVEGFAAATEEYYVELPFGTTAVPTVAATANDANAKGVTVTQATALPGAATVVVKAEDNTTTKTYSINFTVADSKDLLLVFRTGTTACSEVSTASAMLSDNAAVSSYINKITFNNVEGTGDNGKETGGGSGSLDVGKKAGNMLTLSAKPGYALQAMSFYGKIQDETCEYSLDGGAWQTLTSTGQSADKCYAVFADAEVHEFRLRSTGTSGVWIRNMQLTIVEACTPKTIAWTAEPAAEYELGSSPDAIVASANNGTITYASSNSDVIGVDASTGALTLKTLGAVTLSASVPAGNGMIYCNAGAEVSKANVKTYYLVTFDAQNTEAADEVKYFSGDAAIALPAAPSYPGYDFQGWFDTETGGNQYTETITPAASMTVYAQWVAQCAGATITTQPTGASYITGRIPANLVCEATAGNGGELTYEWFTCDDDQKTNPVAATATPSTAAVGTYYYFCKVTEAGCDVEAFSNVVTITVADKDPVCIIKATPTSGTEATADGLYKGNAYFKGRADDKKLNTNGEHYVGVALASGYTFQSGDEVRLNQVAEVNGTTDLSKIYLYKEVPTSDNLIVTLDNTGVQGDNVFAMPSEFYGESALYIGRKDASCNPTVGYLAVYRVMNPELMAIKINGRDGEIDPLDDKHFYVTIPYEADLAALTVVPTIVSNTAEASVIKTVESNDGAWVLEENGDNTYRIKDKDGDYTDYTITLKRDVLKHAVKFYDGSTVYETLEVVDGESIAAGDVPADPTKEDYLFQGWAETDGGAVVDVTSFTISAAKNFYAKWVSDGAIKLIVDGTSGKELNTTNFLTGATLASSTVKVDNVDYAYATLGGTAGSPSNIDAANKVIAYHATTTQTKVMIDVFNTSNNSRPIKIMGVIEGSSDVTELATIDWPNSGDPRHIKTQYYEFNNTANRTIYITGTNTVSSVDFLQVKVIESGEQLKKAGEAGYSLNMNKGRLVGQSGLTIDGANIDLNSWYKPTNSTVAKLKETSIRFTVVNPVLLKVTAANNKEYYVTKGSAGTDNSTEKTGVSEFDLTAGTWYITAGGSEVQFTKIEFVAPKCEQPTIANMANSDLCEGDAFAELTVNASVNDEGTLHYAWYKEAGETDEAVGSDAATFTPEADGQYYVIVTNHKDNFTDNSKTSNTITVAHFASAQITTAPADQYKEAGQNATLTVAASGKAPLSYQWYTCDENGDNAVIIAGAEAESYQVAVTAGMSQYYKVIVGSGCGSAEAVAKVAEWTEKDPANVTGSMTWDWKSAAWNGITDNIEFENTGVEQLMANVNAKVPCVDGENGFRSDMLYGTGQFVWRPNGSNDNRFFQGTKIRFITTVPGRVTVRYRNTSGSTNTRTIKITNNGEVLPADGTNTTNSFKNTNPVLVAPGEVIIEGIASETNGLTRIEKIVFNAQADEERNVVIGNMGTVCLPNPSRAFGVNVYELAGKGEGCKVQFDQLAANEVLEAGKAYVLVMTDMKAKFFYTSDETADADWSTAMKGNLSATPIEFQPYDEAAKNVVFFKDNAMWNAYETGLRIKQYRAYLQYDEVTEPANSQPAPGRRRVSLNLNGAQVATGFDNLETSEAPMKVMIDGQLFIIRGEKMFDVTGRLVK